MREPGSEIGEAGLMPNGPAEAGFPCGNREMKSGRSGDAYAKRVRRG